MAIEMPCGSRSTSWILAILIACAACGEELPPPPLALDDENDSQRCTTGETIDTAEEQPPEIECPSEERMLLCFGQWAAHCSPEGKLVELVNCRERDQACAGHKCDSADDCTGCRDCVPGSVRCGEGGERRQCLPDGSGFELAEICDETAGQYCSLRSGACEDLCAAAEREQSYIGCEYWAVATSNAQLDFEGIDEAGLCRPFTFAVVIANPQGIDAQITIVSPGLSDLELTVPPHETRTVELPCAPELKGEFMQDAYSVQTTQAAHHILSNVPVTVYQFNPLEFESTTVEGDRIFSHTNDASLLLPVHSLTGEYLVMAQPTLLHKLTPRDAQEEATMRSGPGFVAIIGVEAEPTEVQIVSSAYTEPSEDGAIPALAPGDALSVTLAQGEVLQLLSATPENCIGEPEDSVLGATLT